jgi:hypothetical protein
MVNQFEELEKAMQLSGAPVLPLLNKGLSAEEIATELKGIRFTLPPEVMSLYQWHNGTKFQEKRYNAAQILFYNALFPALKVAVETYVFYTKTDRDFKKHYFSLFETLGGVMYLINCDRNSPNYGMILIHDISTAISSTVVTTMYDSMACFIETITKCYSQGIYKNEEKDSQVLLNSDWKAEVELSRQMNPKSNYWKILLNEDISN